MNINRLVFKDHSMGLGAKHAVIKFRNGYGASIVTGPYFYTDEDHPYELAILYKGKLCYSTYLTDDVLGHLTAEDVAYLLDKIKALPA